MVVGQLQFDVKGLWNTIRLKNSFELGELLFQVAEMVKAAS